MLRAAVLALLAAMAPAALGAHPATVEQLRQTLAARAGAADGSLAHQVGQMELTEQLTQATLTRMKAEFKPGPKTELALDLLADASWFLKPPAAELPLREPPDPVAQQALMNAAINYSGVTLHRLPNFLATRMTRSFGNTSEVVSRSGWSPVDEMHLAGTYTQEITYRDGHEVVNHPQDPAGKTKQPPSPTGLTTSGEFGPVLAVILSDAAKGKVNWSHWEQTPAGVAAVFTYRIPSEASHYPVNFCCMRNVEKSSAYGGRFQSGPANSYHGTPAYHGTLSIDPATGAILEMTLESELKQTDPITRAAIAVAWGKVEIGDVAYICPVRSVAISETLTDAGGDMIPGLLRHINEVTFTGYHRFGSTVRVVADTPAQ